MAKQTRNRNPAHPAIALGPAIAKAEALYSREGRKPMLAETAAKHWGSSLKSSAALQAISALKQFGLLADERDGKVRKVRLSERALRILLDKRDTSSERLKAIQEAALHPKVYAELWLKAGEDGKLPSDTELEHHLLLKRSPPFYDDAVKGVIKDFKSTIAFANLGKRDILEAEDEEPERPKVGDFVQWISQDVAQFPELRQIIGLSDDGDWAFVEGSETGLPMDELTVEKATEKSAVPPPNPHYRQPPVTLPNNASTSFPLDEGEAVLSWPKEISEASFHDLDAWLEVALNKIARTAGVDRRKDDASKSD